MVSDVRLSFLHLPASRTSHCPAKLEAGKILFNPSPTDLHELGDTIVNDLELSAAIHHVKLQANLPQPGQTVIVDAQLLRRIIENLLTNAIKFSPPNSPVTFTLEYTQDNHLKVTVADWGSGISEENQQRIFNRFEIGDLKANIPQIGLGLAFCKMAVEAQGGTLAIASNTPRGSVFTVEI
ncbi:MAG: sensor histidine kinase [Microcystaceae cyanobacterium]